MRLTTATIAETENTTKAITIPLDESENSKQPEEVYIPTYKTSDENGNPIILENNVPNDAYARN